MSGLLVELEDHNCWTIGEAVGHRGPDRLQHLLSRAVWDEQQVLDMASGWAVGHLGDGDAVLIVDETADEKSSADAVGAARQYSGTVGGIALSYRAWPAYISPGRPDFTTYSPGGFGSYWVCRSSVSRAEEQAHHCLRGRAQALRGG